MLQKFLKGDKWKSYSFSIYFIAAIILMQNIKPSQNSNVKQIIAPGHIG